MGFTDSVLGRYWKPLPFSYGYGGELTQKRRKLRTEEKPEREQQERLGNGTEMGCSDIRKYVSLGADWQLFGWRYHQKIREKETGTQEGALQGWR